MIIIQGLIAFILAIIITYGIRVLAIRKSIMDVPNGRSSHSTPVPRGGGVSIVIIWYIFISYYYAQGHISNSFFYANLAGLIVVVTGMIDDIIHLSPQIRFAFQCLAGGLAIWFLGGMQEIGVGFYNFHEPVTLSILSFVGIIWAINLFNFLDGIDGFIGMETAFIALAAFALFGNELLLILAAAILGFLILNWHPAKIFMGDVGSTFLGFLFAVFCIHYNNLGESSVFTWLILSGLFWFDATFTLYRRWRNGENLSVAHKKHAYQRMVQSGFSHQKTTLYALLVNLLLFAPLALTFYYNMEHLIFIVFLADVTILFLIMKWVDRKKSFLETQ